MDIREQVKLRAETDLEAFIALVHPHRVLGSVHKNLIKWWNREDAKRYQLVLLPRDHQKSAMVAYRVAWEITRNPAVRILYVSSTSNLATKQLKFIKDILTHSNYTYYWPDMVHPDEAKREKWSETEISVDHPKRKKETVRDPTVFAAGLTTNIAGMHCDVAVMDDVVVLTNAYTEEGRETVRMQYSLLASIEGTDAREWIVGTRYHPKDLYYDMASLQIEKYDEVGSVIDHEYLYEKFEEQVEDRGDGTGQFLWPRQQRKDGIWFGFDQDILAQKRSKYVNKTQFRAQYYNNPNDESEAGISRECFQYYDPKYLGRYNGQWTFNGKKLNVYAAVDFAYSLARRADYTCVVVIGVDAYANYYVLEIDRFKTHLISDYYRHILSLHNKWGFRKLRAEVTAAQSVIVSDLKANYIRKDGLSLVVEEYKPSRYQGSKEERIEATLQPKYENRQVWHYPGGNCQTLEEELLLANPPHDDIKDCLAAVIDAAVLPTFHRKSDQLMNIYQDNFNRRFGGIS